MGLYKNGANQNEKWWVEHGGLCYNPPADPMDNEFMDADTVLGRINLEVFELVKLIEKHRDDKVKNVKRLEQSKAELINKKDTQDESLENAISLFKTIMCPLKDRCTKVQKIRWPYSNIKTITRFGQNCPYAHHSMELSFKESFNSRINATEKAKMSQIDAAKNVNIFG